MIMNHKRSYMVTVGRNITYKVTSIIYNFMIFY